MVTLFVIANGEEVYRTRSWVGQIPAKGDTISVPGDPGTIGIVRGRSWSFGTSPMDPTEVLLSLE